MSKAASSTTTGGRKASEPIHRGSLVIVDLELVANREGVKAEEVVKRGGIDCYRGKVTGLLIGSDPQGEMRITLFVTPDVAADNDDTPVLTKKEHSDFVVFRSTPETEEALKCVLLM